VKILRLTYHIRECHILCLCRALSHHRLEFRPPTHQSVIVESNKSRMTTSCYRVHDEQGVYRSKNHVFKPFLSVLSSNLPCNSKILGLGQTLDDALGSVHQVVVRLCQKSADYTQSIAHVKAHCSPRGGTLKSSATISNPASIGESGDRVSEALNQAEHLYFRYMRSLWLCMSRLSHATYN
jgi:hypothetical protein